MVESAPEGDVRQCVRYCQSTKAWVLFPFTAQCLVLCGTCYASVTWCFWSDSAENCGYSAVAGRRFPVVVQRPIPMVLPLQYVLGGRCSCCARQVPMVQILQKFVEVPQSQFLWLWTSLYYAATRCLATVKVPQIQFIAGVSGPFCRHRDMYAQFLLCMVGLLTAMRGIAAVLQHFSASVLLDVEAQGGGDAGSLTARCCATPNRCNRWRHWRNTCVILSSLDHNHHNHHPGHRTSKSCLCPGFV